ncbi:MAG: acyltransferase family protein [Myxococcales bacterium]|nr:acyltransferase family protein [Myxococcales bacterium]
MLPVPDARVLGALKAVYEAIRTSDGEDPSTKPDLGFDPHFFEQVTPLLDFLWERYFRVRLSGLENLPDSGPALMVSNHSGGLPYDGMMLAYGVRKLHPQHRLPRPLVANFAFRSRVMRPVVARFGGVRASMENATRLLEEGQVVSVFPEGLRGVGKLYRERYRLTRFGRGGFVRLAAAAGVPIIPTAIVGAEEIHPVIGKLTAPARWLGLPYIPITPTFPFLGPLGLLPLPTKWHIQVGKPIVAPTMALDDTSAVLEAAEQVRGQVDTMIAEMLLERRSIFFG